MSPCSLRLWCREHVDHHPLSVWTAIGVASDYGIASTAYGARDLDFNLVIVRDCCSDSLADTMDQFMERVFPFMARVRTLDETIAMMQAGGA